jgi:VanZ family protein
MPGSVVTAPPTRRWGSLSNLASAWIPVLVCILVISMESTVYFGADHTSGPLQRFFEFLLHRHFTGPQWWRLHLIIRKWGHFTGYGILSIAWFRAFWMTWPLGDGVKRSRITLHSLAMLGTLLVASGDEFHQTFLPNRTGSIWDVLLDCCGGLLMQLLVWLWMRKRFRD